MPGYNIDPFGQLRQERRWQAQDKLNRQQLAGQNALRDIQQQSAELGLRQGQRGEAFQNALSQNPQQAQQDYPMLYNQAFPGQKPVYKELGLGDYGPAGIYDVSGGNKRFLGNAPKKQPLISTTSETEYDKTIGKGNAESYLTIQRDASDALTNKARYSRARQLIEKTKGKTGTAGEARMIAKRLGKAFGVDVGDVGVLEALKGMSVDLTMDVVQKTKGAVSNKEMELFAQTAPGLSNTYEGNLLLLEMYDRLADLKQQEAKLARKYKNKNGRFDSGYYEEQAKFHRDNPLFTTEMQNKVQNMNTPDTKPDVSSTGLEQISDQDLLGSF